MAATRDRVAGVEIELREAGSGRDLLFLHPGTGVRDHSKFLDRLAQDFRVVAVSHPGFDGSDRPKHFDTVDDLAYFYLELIEQHGLRDLVLVGASLGAWLAAEIAIKSSAALSSLVLIGPIGAKFGAPDTREIVDLFSYPSYGQDRLLYRDPAFGLRGFQELSQPELVTIARNHESFGRLGWVPTLHDPKLRYRLYRVHCPTLVLQGDADAVISADYGRAFAAEIAGSSFETIVDAGHYAQVEQSEAVAARIASFAAVEETR